MSKIHVFLFVILIIAASIFQQCEQGEEGPQPMLIYLPIIYAPQSALRGVCGFAYFDKIGAKWAHSWTPNTGSNPEFIPMIRDAEDMSLLVEAIENAQATGWLMGFNEPDLPPPPGSLISPTDGAIFWRTIENAATSIKLVSPAPSQNNFGWLWQMVAAYESLYGRKPRFDAIGIHYYGIDPDAAKAYLTSVRQQALAYGYNVPLWLTEFAGYCTLPHPQNGNERMMRELIPWMKQQSWIGRYAWFMARIRPVEPGLSDDFSSCSLTNWETGELTELGELYGSFE